MPDHALKPTLNAVAPGSWAVGVSGGADSVALLLLLCERPDLHLHVVHLDHQTRGDASTGDARFVVELSKRLGLPCTLALRSDVEATMADIPANDSSRYRAARLALFRRVARDHALGGVLLAHHADDRAETILHRLLRGSGPAGLSPLELVTDLGGLRIVRPLLEARADEIRRYLTRIGQPWREDASNASDAYAQINFAECCGMSRS